VVQRTEPTPSVPGTHRAGSCTLTVAVTVPPRVVVPAKLTDTVAGSTPWLRAISATRSRPTASPASVSLATATARDASAAATLAMFWRSDHRGNETTSRQAGNIKRPMARAHSAATKPPSPRSPTTRANALT
jgi:hypothetical protein